MNKTELAELLASSGLEQPRAMLAKTAKGLMFEIYAGPASDRKSVAVPVKATKQAILTALDELRV